MRDDDRYDDELGTAGGTTADTGDPDVDTERDVPGASPEPAEPDKPQDQFPEVS